MPDDPAPETEEVSEVLEGLAGAGSEAAEETAEAASEGGKSLSQRLMSTSPAKPLDQLDSPWDPSKGGLTRVYRGIIKMGAMDGMPAIGDMMIGAAESAYLGYKHYVEQSQDQAQDENNQSTPVEGAETQYQNL